MEPETTSRAGAGASDPEIGLIVALLRVVRGWNQSRLAEAAGKRGSAISDYERGRRNPELQTLTQLLEAMGYPLAAVETTRTFLWRVRAEALGENFPPPEVGAPVLDNLAALRFELEEASADIGRATARVARAALLILSHSVLPYEVLTARTGRAGGASQEATPEGKV